MGSPEINYTPAEVKYVPVQLPEVGVPRHISKKQFKKTTDLDSLKGAIIEGVKPQDLFISQHWTDTFKIGTVYDLYQSRSGDDKDLLKAYVAYRPINGSDQKQRVIVLPDGHHRALAAWEQGEKVDIFILGTKPTLNYAGISTLRQKSGLPFRDM